MRGQREVGALAGALTQIVAPGGGISAVRDLERCGAGVGPGRFGQRLESCVRGNKSIKGSNNRLMVYDAPFPGRALAFLNGRKKLLFTGNEGSQRLGDKPRFRAPRFRGQAAQLGVKIGVDARS